MTNDARTESISVPTEASVVSLPARHFLAGAVIAAAAIAVIGRSVLLPRWLLASEVLGTIVALFLLGSFKYQIHKNALTYGMLLVIAATFGGLQSSEWHSEIAERGLWTWTQRHVLSFSGLDELIHADTMLFILGLTFFVAVIAQTRVLEGITLGLLRRYRGAVLPTVISITAAVAFASGILDGVSMIGLTIRTLVIIMMLAAAPVSSVRYAVMVCAVVTTVCGIWLAYGEPPNLIMKANLEPHLDNAFFLRYCAPVAVACFLVIVWELRSKLQRQRVDLQSMDVLDANAQDVRFLQATRHGEVMTPVELIEGHASDLGGLAPDVIGRLQTGEPLGIALVRSGVPESTRRMLLGHFVTDELADGLDRHYVFDNAGMYEEALQSELAVDDVLKDMAKARRRAQLFGALSLVPFIAMLVLHSIRHEVPLFVASFAGFLAALPGIMPIPKMRRLAFQEACHEFAEYYFLFPLFLSITLLTEAGFFDQLQTVLHQGIETVGPGHVAVAQFAGSAMLSAILDNNVVADFGARALQDLDVTLLHLFALAQIAGYAIGGCWTHIGSAQSVVAFAFIRRDVDDAYTPVQWMRDMTPLVIKLCVVAAALIYVESALLQWLL